MTSRMELKDRRRIIKGIAFGAAAFATPGLFAEQLVVTPPVGEGPFYPDKMPLDTDNDLLIINDSIAPAVGEITHLTGRVLSKSGQPIRNADPTAHAEVLALRSACTRAGNYRLPGATLYVSVEPCVMCVGALIQARIGRIVYGCAEPKAGALGSVHDVGRDGRLNHSFEVRGGVCAAAAAKLLKEFFSARRGA